MKRSLPTYDQSNFTQKRLILVFPKSFEFFKFIQYFIHDDNYRILDVVSENDTEHTLFIRDRAARKVYKFQIFVVGQSDINFNSIFSGLVQDNYHLLIGSCGSAVLEDMGKLFYITTAAKGDRGFLDSKQQFTIDSKKTSESRRPTD